MSFISTPDWQEKKGRTEDGPVDTKKKFSEWPGKHTQATGKATAKKASTKTSTAKPSSSAGSKSSSNSSSGKGK